MTDSREKGSFQTDIPADAVEEALRSVERVTNGEGQPSEVRPSTGSGRTDGVELEVEADAEPEEAPEVASLRAQLELSQAKGRETLEKLREEHERLLRTAADLDNYKKRAAKEREEIQRFGNEKLLKDFLPVLDNLDRALAAAPEGAFAEGVRLVRSSFEAALAKHGVKAFSALGAPFDPARHEALLQVPTAESPPGTVVLEHARGFTLSDRLLRPALVGVAVAPGSDSSAGGPSGEAR